MNREDRKARRDRLGELMQRDALGAILMRRPENFAWCTGGGNSRVEYASPLGAADIVVTADGEAVLASTIEAPRMRAEEALGLEVLEYPWHDGPEAAVRELVGEGPLRADVQLDNEPGMTENFAAEAIAGAWRGRGLVPTVLLAATDERIRRFRHPLPTAATVERRVMLVASAQREWLYANLSLIVHFEEPDSETAQRQAACDQILARMRDEATRAGRALADAFGDCRRFYADEGFPDEWRLHHQGGPTGYASREVIATPQTAVPIEVGQAFAWNPSITGAKSEETYVLTETGPEVVAGAPAAVR